MNSCDFQKSVQCRFESCLKKTVRHVVKDYTEGIKRREKKEVLFSDLPTFLIDSFSVYDDNHLNDVVFLVEDSMIWISDEDLANALQNLSECQRNTLLMYYCLEMNHEEIAQVQHISRSGVFQNKNNALTQLKKLLKKEG